jgi:chemotaxis signal transduction protein
MKRDPIAVLAERARKYAAPGAAPERERGREFLAFWLGGERFLVEARFVLEAVEREIVPLPLAPPRLLGLANLRGTILPVFDLIRTLGQSPRAGPGDSSRLVVLGIAGPEAAIVADSLDSVVRVKDTEIIAMESAARDDSCVLGATGDAAVVLDGRALLEGPWLVLEDSNAAQRTPEVSS